MSFPQSESAATGQAASLYGHPIYNMTSPRSTAITSEAAALDAQTRANMQGARGICRVAKPHQRSRHERVPGAAGPKSTGLFFGMNGKTNRKQTEGVPWIDGNSGGFFQRAARSEVEVLSGWLAEAKVK
jgi:hypothetical protein